MRWLRAIQQEYGNPNGLQLMHLVCHQRDQGRNHNGEAFQYQSWKLKAQALAGACRHDADHVIAVQNVLNNFSLVRTKVREPEDPLQKIINAVHKNGFRIYCIAVRWK